MTLPQQLASGHLYAALDRFGREGGIAPGSFGTSILDAATHADSTNLQRLFEAFPEWVRPWDFVRESAAGEGAVRLALGLIGAGISVNTTQLLRLMNDAKRGVTLEELIARSAG